MNSDRSRQNKEDPPELKGRWYQTLLEVSPDAVVTMGLDGKIVDWSHQAETLFGWSREAAIGQLLGTLIVPPAQRDAHWNGLERFRLTGKSHILNQQLHMTAMCRDGREIQVDLWITPVRIGETNYIAGFLRNRMEARSADQAAPQREAKTRLVQQASTLSLSIDSFDEALQRCLELMCSVTGWPVGHALLPDESKDRLIASGAQFCTVPAEFSDILERLGTIRVDEGQGLAAEVWKSGEVRWKSRIQPTDMVFPPALAEATDVIKGAFAFPVNVGFETAAVLEFYSTQEITPDPQLLLLAESLGTQLGRIIERRQWEDERAQLAAIVDSSYDAIIGKDIAGNIISWNTASEQIYGYTAEEAIGQSISIILPEGVDAEEDEIQQAMKTGRRLVQFETIRRRKDDSEIAVALTVSPIRDSKGRIIGSSTIERDISQRKQREAAFENARNEAIAARDQAESANRTKTEFLANISHELRTPMNAIIGMLELALVEQLNPEMRDYLSTARDSADTLLFLLDDLLDFSRMEAGRLELEVEPFDIRKVVDGTMKTLSLKAYEKGLELAGEVSQDVPLTLRGDGNRVRQIMTNLTGNAIKFTEQGEVVLSLQVESLAQDDVLIRLAVRDTGVGISKEDQERIFTPFEQVDASTTRQQAGTGLGLAICHELVEKMSGRIWLESDVGQGTTFYCTMRFGVANDPVLTPTDSIPDLSDLRVLVVDDNESNRRILTDTLRNWSMQPTVIASGREALQSIISAERQGQPFPLIIVDALMPDIDGFTLLETLQAQGMTETAAVLMLSAADRQAFKDRCEKLAIAAFLEKPISQSDMHDAVMTALLESNPDEIDFSPLEIQTRSRKILAAEDTPANQKVVKAILEKQGHTVTVVHNGREAIDAHQQETFDVILMDVQMPVMDGLQATEAIRNLDDQQLSQIPIIAMTAHARREDRLRCLKAGMDAYISKPIDAARLLQLIETTRHHSIPSGGPVNTQRRSSVQPRQQSSTVSEPTGMIDRAAAIKRMGGSAELFADVCRFFNEDSPGLLAEIERGVADADLPAVTRAAHSLRGLAGNFNAEPVVTAAQRLEDAAAAGETDILAALATVLRKLVDRLTDEIDGLQA